jgi:hypothetical protein
MRQYIVNLTNNLIGKNRYDEIFRRMDNKEEFLTHVKFDLDSGDVRDMSSDTLGKIMFSFEIGDVLSGHPGKEVTFSGDCEDLLREIVSICLAYVIRSRLNGESNPYARNSPFGLVESGFKGIIDQFGGEEGKRKGIPPFIREVPFLKPDDLKAHLAKLPQTETKLDFIGYSWKGSGEYIGVFEDKKNRNRFNMSKNQCQQANSGVNGILMSEVLAKWPNQ